MNERSDIANPTPEIIVIVIVRESPVSPFKHRFPDYIDSTFIVNSVPMVVIIRLDRIIQFFFWIAQSSWAMTETEKLKQTFKIFED